MLNEASCIQSTSSCYNFKRNCMAETSEFTTQHPRKKQRKAKEADISYSHLEDAVDVLRSITSKPPPEEDELDAFGKSIVLQMRKLPEEHNIELISEIQHLISTKHRECLRSTKSLPITPQRSLSRSSYISVPSTSTSVEGTSVSSVPETIDRFGEIIGNVINM